MVRINWNKEVHPGWLSIFKGNGGEFHGAGDGLGGGEVVPGAGLGSSLALSVLSVRPFSFAGL